VHDSTRGGPHSRGPRRVLVVCTPLHAAPVANPVPVPVLEAAAAAAALVLGGKVGLN
jgi:hypothetical protein